MIRLSHRPTPDGDVALRALPESYRPREMHLTESGRQALASMSTLNGNLVPLDARFQVINLPVYTGEVSMGDAKNQ